MKKLIFRKLLKDIFVNFIIISISLSLIVWVIQAVNFLDYISEDGHGFGVYFSYTLLIFPKVFTKLFIIVFFISIFYIILKYENNNELIIFWTLGISKIEFIKNITKFSILMTSVLIFFTTYMAPYSQDTARSFIRNSNIDFLPSLIREKKFIYELNRENILKIGKYEARRTMERHFGCIFGAKPCQESFGKNGLSLKGQT